MYSYSDTIAAIATAPGEGGVAIVRLSGPDAAALLGRVFRPADRRPPRPRELTYGRVVDPAGGEPIDEAMAVLMPPPRTYTREPVAEIHCHGGAVVPRRVLAACLAAGARAAEPGELTLRAFLNGRLDLAQAEAVLDLVRARTDAQARLALRGLGGALSDRVRPLRQRALDLLAEVTAAIDFPEDDVPEPAIADRLGALTGEVAELLASAHRGGIVRAGARVAMVGRPNVGKSSLLNALLGVERAIVTPVPGTTRDTVEETFDASGIPLTLVDTAGIRDSADAVERLGVERARAAARSADVLLLVLDGSEPLVEDDRAVLALASERPAIVVLNKSDLPPGFDDADLPLPGRRRATPAPGPDGPAAPEALVAPNNRAAHDVAVRSPATGYAVLAVSAVARTGLDALADALLAATGLTATTGEALLPANARHEAAIRVAIEALTAASQSPHADIRAALLTEAVEHLGSITGESVGDDLLHAIFSRFCIGK